ncbi:MAG: histidine kinase [Desulfobacterales bacterium]|nr:histidine kinase [Desulfobacterales bacterium]
MDDRLFFKRKLFVPCIFAFALLLGLIASEYLVHFGNNRERRHLIQLAETAAVAIDAAQVSHLRGIPEEVESTEYKLIKRQVERLHTHVPEAGFVYIMSLTEDRAGGVFLADSEPSDSKDAVIPGEIWEEATKEFIDAFKTGESFTEGPMKDKWGVWVTGFAAIRHPETQSVYALLGIDIRANQWKKTILSYRLLGYALTLFLLLLVSLFFIYANKIHRLNDTLECKVKDRTNDLKSLNNHLIEVEQNERDRLSSILHDSVAQTLALSISNIKTLRKSQEIKDTNSLEIIQKYLEISEHQVRTIIYDLSSQVLRDFDIGAALDFLIERNIELHKLKFEYINNTEKAVIVSETSKVLLYRGVNELLQNIVTHSCSERAEIELYEEENYVCVRVEDFGVGIDLNSNISKNTGGLGLLDLKERIITTRGDFSVESVRDLGTKIVIKIPKDK